MRPIHLLVALLAPVPLYSQSVLSYGDLKNGKAVDDTTFIYTLPYKPGKSYFLIQGYDSKLSHKGEIALDFKMKRGTPVCAMRNGTVVEIKEDSDRGGLKRKYFADGNYVLVRHDDDSFAWYFHLKKEGVLVDVGDIVEQGQLIGYSGNSGYSAFPHLHVEVVVKDDDGYRQIPMRFRLREGDRYLKPGRFYRNYKLRETLTDL